MSSDSPRPSLVARMGSWFEPVRRPSSAVAWVAPLAHDRATPEALRATAAAVGLASMAWAWMLAGPVVEAGLAPVAVAVVVAVGFGAQFAAWERRHQPLVRPTLADGTMLVAGDSRIARGAAQVQRWLLPRRAGTFAHGAVALAESVGALSVGAVLADQARPFGPVGLGLAVAAWPLSAWVLRRLPLAVVLPATAALVVAGVGALAALPSAPWTVLEPRYAGAAAWAPGAVVAGLLTATAGMGHWSTARSGPTRRRLAWLGTAVAAAGMLAVLVAAGGAWERSASDGRPGFGVMAPLAVALGALAGVAAVVGRDDRDKRWRALEGAAATAWWAWPAEAAVPGWWSVLLPIGLAAVSASCAWLVRGWGALWALGAVGISLGALGAAWNGLPNDAWTAAALAATAVGVCWRVGLQVVLEEE